MAPLATVFHCDNSMLSTFASCEMAGWLRYGQHRTTPSEKAALKAGGDTARALALLRLGHTPDVALKEFDRTYQPWAQVNVQKGDRLEWQNCRTVLEQYMRRGWPEQQGRIQVIRELVEVTFELPLTPEGDIIYMGRTDAAGYWDGLDVVVLDDKTTGSLNDYWARKWRMESGQSGYVWALREMGYPVVGTVINGIEYKQLPSDPTRKCGTHKVPYAECRARHAKFGFYGPFPREPQFLEEWRADATETARRMAKTLAQAPTLEHARELPMTGQLTGACGNCEFMDLCLSGRSPALLEANTVEQKWDPRELAVG